MCYNVFFLILAQSKSRTKCHWGILCLQGSCAYQCSAFCPLSAGYCPWELTPEAASQTPWETAARETTHQSEWKLHQDQLFLADRGLCPQSRSISYHWFIYWLLSYGANEINIVHINIYNEKCIWLPRKR